MTASWIGNIGEELKAASITAKPPPKPPNPNKPPSPPGQNKQLSMATFGKLIAKRKCRDRYGNIVPCK